MKDIGQKRKTRAKKVRGKMINRRERIMKEAQTERQKARMDYRSRRRHEPLVNDLKVNIQPEVLEENLQKLREMEQEFVEVDKRRQEQMEHAKDNQEELS